jgi:hypothetical protein
MTMMQSNFCVGVVSRDSRSFQNLISIVRWSNECPLGMSVDTVAVDTF